MKSEERQLKILELVVDSFIKTGEPIGSATLATLLGNAVSSATIRNDMAALERMGFLEQPHTSAGRVPTYLGYRVYINHLMKPEPLSDEEKHRIDAMVGQHPVSATALLDNALTALAEVTGYAAVNTSNLPHFSVITKVEVVPAGYHLYALLLITSTGDVRNKICRLEFDLSNDQLAFFENLVSNELLGVTVEQLSPEMIQQLALALGSYALSLSPLLYAVYELSDEISQRHVEMRGEGNLLRYSDFDANELIAFLNTKNEISKILSSAFDGIRVVFGKEEETFSITNSSLIFSKYGASHSAGSFGILGPIRLDYAKVIPYMEYFSHSISEMIDHLLADGQKGDETDAQQSKRE